MNSEAIDRAAELVSGPGFIIPYPGEGATGQRFRRLIELTEASISTGRMVEAHCDAAAILHELGGPSIGPGELWGVWASEPPTPVVTAVQAADGWRLSGVKQWCSGARGCTHALLTARTDRGRALFAVDLRSDGIRRPPAQWTNQGMAATETGSVEFDDVAAAPVGEPGAYLDRPGFWHGGVGVAACWFGGARKVAQFLLCKGSSTDDEILMMHVGAVDALLATGEAVLYQAALEIDERPDDLAAARRRAFRVRWSIEQIADAVMDRVSRALGPAPLVADVEHAQAVADLSVYIRQSHADHDLVELGRLVGQASS